MRSSILTFTHTRLVTALILTSLAISACSTEPTDTAVSATQTDSPFASNLDNLASLELIETVSHPTLGAAQSNEATGDISTSVDNGQEITDTETLVTDTNLEISESKPEITSAKPAITDAKPVVTDAEPSVNQSETEPDDSVSLSSISDLQDQC